MFPSEASGLHRLTWNLKCTEGCYGLLDYVRGEQSFTEKQQCWGLGDLGPDGCTLDSQPCKSLFPWIPSSPGRTALFSGVVSVRAMVEPRPAEEPALITWSSEAWHWARAGEGSILGF